MVLRHGGRPVAFLSNNRFLYHKALGHTNFRQFPLQTGEGGVEGWSS